MRFKVRVTLRDPDGVEVMHRDIEGQTNPGEDDPGDQSVVDNPFFEEAARFLASMACEGKACSVTVEDRCSFPGCNAPADIGGLCLPDAKATL